MKSSRFVVGKTALHSDEQCVFAVELDGIREEPNPLRLDLGELEDALTDPAAQALLTEALRAYGRRVLGR